MAEEKILLVDDEPDILNTFKTLLTMEGFHVRTASGGKQAIDICTSEPIDLAIIDIRMPRMNGIELIKHLKRLNKDLEIIVLSGFATVDNAIEALHEGGAFDFLKKPLENLDEFFHTIKQALEKRRLRLQNRRLLEELKQHHDHLEELVNQRTAELSHANKELRSENTQRRRAEEALQWEASVNAALAELSKALISTESIDDISELVMKNATHLTESSSGLVGYIEPQTGDLIRIAMTHDMWDRCPIPNNTRSPKRFDGLRRRGENKKTPLLTNGLTEDLTSGDLREGQMLSRCCLSVPAMIGEKLLGHIALANSNREYTQRDLALIEKMANLYAIAIQRKLSQEEKAMLQDRLRRSQKFEAIGTLASGIAHDFNNVIYSILGNAELALDNIPKESIAYDDIDQIIVAGKRAADLVQQILTFSRQNTSVRQPLALQPIIQEAVKFLDRTLLQVIEVRLNIDAVCGLVLVDPTQIFQVVMNLCINALHAMREGGGVLELWLKDMTVDSKLAATHQDLAPGNYVRLTVKDTGHGMTKATMERIFDPFYTTKKIGEGTGMGLSMVLGIIKNHDGAITVKSEPGQGARFDVFFPKY